MHVPPKRFVFALYIYVNDAYIGLARNITNT